MKVLSYVSVVIVCALPQTAAAVENDPGIWLTFSTSGELGSGDVDGRWRYWFDTQARYFDVGSGINQLLARPGIGYRFNSTTRGWFGYARFRTRGRSGATVDENRYWQQLDWSTGQWSMRARFEQRAVSSGDDIGLVTRLRVKYVRPIAGEESANLVLAIEPFVNLRDTDWGGESGLRQNRVVIGFGRQLNARVSIEAGYMNQYLWVDGGENRSNHFGVLHFSVRL